MESRWLELCSKALGCQVMNTDATSQPGGGDMNENSDVQTNPDPIPSSRAMAVSGPPAAHWLKSFLACNPFYLVSAALLLYGFYLVSVDPGFLQREISQLFFNFTALQFYEILLVI